MTRGEPVARLLYQSFIIISSQHNSSGEKSQRQKKNTAIINKGINVTGRNARRIRSALARKKRVTAFFTRWNIVSSPSKCTRWDTSGNSFFPYPVLAPSWFFWPIASAGLEALILIYSSLTRFDTYSFVALSVVRHEMEKWNGSNLSHKRAKTLIWRQKCARCVENFLLHFIIFLFALGFSIDSRPGRLIQNSMGISAHFSG